MLQSWPLVSVVAERLNWCEAHNRASAAGASGIIVLVHVWFMIEIYGFTHSLHTFLACAAHGAIAMEDLEDLEDRR